MKVIAIATAYTIFACSAAAQTAVTLVSETGSSGRNLEFTSDHEVIPHLAVGGVWTTTVTFVNLGFEQAVFTVEFFRPTSEPWSLLATGAGEDSAFQVALPARGSIDLEFPSRRPNIETGWGGFTQPPNTIIGAHAIFTDRTPGRPVFEAVVPLTDSFEGLFLMPFDNTNGNVTCLAVTNSAAVVNSNTLEFLDPGGNVVFSASREFLSGNQTSFCLTAFPELANRKGVIRSTVSSASPGGTLRRMSALGFRFNPGGAFTTLFPMTAFLSP